MLWINYLYVCLISIIASATDQYIIRSGKWKTDNPGIGWIIVVDIAFEGSPGWVLMKVAVKAVKTSAGGWNPAEGVS